MTEYRLHPLSSRLQLLAAPEPRLPSFRLHRRALSLHDRAVLHSGPDAIAFVHSHIFSPHRTTHIVGNAQKRLFVLRYAAASGSRHRELRAYHRDGSNHVFTIRYVSQKCGFTCQTSDGGQVFRAVSRRSAFSVLLLPGYDAALFVLLASLAADIWAL